MIQINKINTNDINSSYYKTKYSEGKLIKNCSMCGLPLPTSRLDGLCWKCFNK